MVTTLGVATVVVSLQACAVDAPLTSACADDDVRIDGAVGWVDVSRRIPFGANTFWSGRHFFGAERNGFTALIETDVTVVPGGESAPARGWIRFASGGGWYHLGEGSTMKLASNFQPSLVLSGLRGLPSCDAGVTVDAIATYCQGAVNPFCEAGATFAQAGVTTKIAPGNGGFGSTRAVAAGILAGDAAIMVTFSDADPAVGGFFVLPMEHPDAGALYCARTGTRALEEPNGLNALFTLQDFTRIGGPQEGQLLDGTVTMSICR